MLRIIKQEFFLGSCWSTFSLQAMPIQTLCSLMVLPATSVDPKTLLVACFIFIQCLPGDLPSSLHHRSAHGLSMSCVCVLVLRDSVSGSHGLISGLIHGYRTQSKSGLPLLLSVLHLTKGNYRPEQAHRESMALVRQRILTLVHMGTNNDEMSSCQEQQSQLRVVVGHVSPHWQVSCDTSVQQCFFYTSSSARAGSDSSRRISAPRPGPPDRCSS